MARSIFGETSPEEAELLHTFLHGQPELQQQYELLLNTLASSSEAGISEAKKTEREESIRRIIKKAERAGKEKTGSRTVIFRRYIPLAAASIMLLIIGGWFFFSRDNGFAGGQEKTAPAVVTQNGARKQVVLPDGSKVWLNGGSKLFYNNDFNGAAREVTLEGEAFFDVVKNTSRPFIVHANNINIKVLGTAFNVKAYVEDEKVETTLYRGLVNITKSHDASFQPIMLYPNQKIIIPKEVLNDNLQNDNRTSASTTIKKSIVIQQIDSAKLEPQRIETAWMYNRLEFRGDDFKELAQKLERWYNVEITFEDESVKKLSFSGSFEKETVEQALQALSVANSFNYKISEHEIFISSSK